MDSRTNWIKSKICIGWILLALGVLVGIGGIIVQLQYAHLPYNFRIITGIGILLAALGVANLVRYRAAMKDEQSARRLTAEVYDERSVLIRARAGNRAYWVSTALVYIGLMWASYAANGGLPDLGRDTLWYFLAVCVLLPFGVYVTSVLIDQRNL
jgi:ABC-type uncharacterized transport system permease subunit